MPLTLEDRVLAADHLLKAVIAALTIKDETFVKQLNDIFLIAHAQRDPIARMNMEAWSEIQRELAIVRSFTHGDEDAADEVAVQNDRALASGV